MKPKHYIMLAFLAFTVAVLIPLCSGNQSEKPSVMKWLKSIELEPESKKSTHKGWPDMVKVKVPSRFKGQPSGFEGQPSIEPDYYTVWDYPDDAVFPPLSEFVADEFVAEFIDVADSQYRAINDLKAQLQWSQQHLEIALDLLEKKPGQVAITAYESPEYTPFVIDPNHLKDEMGLVMINNKITEMAYTLIVDTSRGEARIRKCQERLKQITAEPVPAEKVLP